MLTLDGVLDADWADNGILFVDATPGLDDIAIAMRVDHADRAVILGGSFNGTDVDIVVKRVLVRP